jgi:Ca-activated chloride channel family protein
MDADVLLVWLREQGLDFRLPELLWALLLIPALLLFYAGARRQRRRIAGAFQVPGGGRPRRRPAAAGRLLALGLLLLGLAGLIVGFARPVLPLETPNDRATVVVVVDASLAMRSTDVRPTRFEAAKAAARAAVSALPDRAQVAVVGYSRTAYILLAPTHDHGAAPVAISRLRTAEGAAAGDALAVALAAIPLRDAAPSGGAADRGPAAGGTAAGPAAAKVPAAIVLIASGENTTGRRLEDAVAPLREAGVPVHTVGIGPRGGAERSAPFDEGALRQIAQVTGGRYLPAPAASDWKQLYQRLGSAVIVERKPQEVGHVVGAGALSATALSMVISLFAARRLV